jgi:hypothetical protein
MLFLSVLNATLCFILLANFGLSIILCEESYCVFFFLMAFSLHIENGLIVALSNSHDFLKKSKKMTKYHGGF